MRAEYFAFQPFSSRAGYDTVTGVRFAYAAETVDALKALLGELRRRGRWTFGPRWQPGGWLPEARCWFLEPAVWSDVQWLLEEHGYELEAIARPADVPHYGAAIAPAAEPPLPPTESPPPPASTPPERACRHCQTALHRCWVTVIYSIVVGAEPVIAGFCDLGCLQTWLAAWAPRLQGGAPARAAAEVSP